MRKKKKEKELEENNINETLENKEEKEIIKRKLFDFKNFIKHFFLWFIIILYLEFTYRLYMNLKIDVESSINILLYTTTISCFLSLLLGFLKGKVYNVFTSIVIFVIILLFGVEAIFFKIFQTCFSLSNLALGDQAASFFSDAVKGIISNFYVVLIVLLPFVLFLIFKKKLKLDRIRPLNIPVLLLIMGLTITGFYFYLWSGKEDASRAYNAYYNVNDMAMSIDKMGVLNAYRLDFQRLVFGFEQELEEEVVIDEPKEKEEKVYEPNTITLNLDKATSNAEIQKISNYIKSDKGTLKNEYTGMFKGYNIVYITAESFSDLGVDEKLTPTLYKLTHTGFKFNNFYAPYVLSTIGGELQSLTGLYPDNSILTTWRKGTNYFPYGLGTTLRNAGYNTYAYHNNAFGFQDRHKYLKSQGFNNFLACYNGLEKRINCRVWPQSDDQMIEKTTGDYINSAKPFLAYYMTVSGHFQYNFKGDNSMAKKHQKEVDSLNATTSAKAYVATQIELDKALERLISTLKAAGKLENTVIVLLGDHYPYALKDADIKSLTKYPRDSVVEYNHSNLILWNSLLLDEEVDKTCMSVDVIPTVLNLFGIDYDSRLFTGRDIFSTSDGIAIMKNHSWVTDKGTYFAANGKFVPKEGVEVDENYVKNINNIVSNRLNISRLIIKNNYYNYLMR